VYTSGACTTCPIKRSHVGSIEPKLREMVGYEKIFVHDYFDDE
jgi:Fe-S cluster biogenesis protein NfuA